MFYDVIHSPIGKLLLRSEDRALSGLAFLDEPFADRTGWVRDPARFASWARQLGEYFAGGRKRFDGDIAMAGTDFQRRVWTELRRIPYGRTASYGDIAQRIGCPRAVRAVGLANKRNPIAIVVPCHRVIGADGSLTGYGGGLERKRFLLRLEACGADARST